MVKARFMKWYCVILIQLMLLTSCTKAVDERPIFDPFEINYNVTEKGLIESGYIDMPEDVPLLGKQVGDTLIYYQLNYECDSITLKCVNTNVNWRNCIIYFANIDSSSLERFVSKYDADMITSFIHSDDINLYGSDVDSVSHISWGFHGKFNVKHRFSQQIFQCYIGRATGSIDEKIDGYQLSIKTEFPWNEEQTHRYKSIRR